MKKTEFITALAEKQGITKKEATANLAAVLETIESALTIDGSVQFIGFGTFKKKAKPSRTGVNPSTGKPIEISARNAVSFKAGTELNKSIN